MKSLFTFFLSIGLGIPLFLFAAMTGGSFEIYADSFGVIDSQGSTGGDFALYGSGEAFQASTSSGGVYVLRGGFQSEEKGILSFSVSDTDISFGTLSTALVKEAAVTTTISTDSATGYTMYIADDGNLRSGTDDIDDVLDGSVTAGAEEYGFITTGSDALTLVDTSITTSLSPIATSVGEVLHRDVGVTFRVAISPSTAVATYSHAVTFSVTVNP